MKKGKDKGKKDELEAISLLLYFDRREEKDGKERKAKCKKMEDYYYISPPIGLK
jgi:hypothetical protein